MKIQTAEITSVGFSEIHNCGKDIAPGTNYWKTPLAKKGMLYLSHNAGAARLLIPDSWNRGIPSMRKGAKYIVVSMLPIEKQALSPFAVEFLIEDGSKSPWSWNGSMGQFDFHVCPANGVKKGIGSIWCERDGKPHKIIERPAYFRTVEQLPCFHPVDLGKVQE